MHYGSSRLSRACVNHFRNMSSVSIISVKPARLIFTVETIEGGPDSVMAVAHAVIGILERQADEFLQARAKRGRACAAALPTARSSSATSLTSDSGTALPGFMPSASAIAGQMFSQVKTSPLVTLKASLRPLPPRRDQAMARASRSTSTACADARARRRDSRAACPARAAWRHRRRAAGSGPWRRPWQARRSGRGAGCSSARPCPSASSRRKFSCAQ